MAEQFEACERGRDENKRKTDYIQHLISERNQAATYVSELRKKFDVQAQVVAIIFAVS